MWDAFKKQIGQILPEISSELLDAMDSIQYPSIRYNSSKKIIENLPGSYVPWEKNAVQLHNSPRFYLDPNWHAGAYYVQESSSMFLGHVISNLVNSAGNDALKILDLCAAPGGKSTHILDVIPDNSLLVSNEILSKRNAILRENLIRWGKPNVIITQNDANDFSAIENYFDIVVIDAPCSGEGLFRKDKEAINEWSLENVSMCAHRQQEILQSILPCIKENGFLIYSTCTFEPSENEEQVKWLLENGFEIVPVDIRSFNEITEGFLPNTYRFYPHKTEGSGLFLACLKKVKSQKPKAKSAYSKNFKKYLRLDEIKMNAIENWIEHPAKFSILQTPYAIHAFPKELQEELFYLNQYLHITYFGTEIGELKKEIFIPAHALALSTIIKKDLPTIVVDLENALKFLRKNPLTISIQSTIGWHLIKYDALNLGWVKVLQDRINNYLPNNWRILH